MCSVIVLRRPDHPWPLLLAANRDEMADRPWLPPARHWPDRPEVIAGRDVLANGTWLGINDWGVVAAVLNRVNTLGPAPGRRSRGELPLEALDHADATTAATALADIDPRAYRPFNLIIADHRDGYWLCCRDDRGGRPIEIHPLPEGLSMVTAFDLNDPASPRTRRYRPLFEAAPCPDPDRGDWQAWERLLADRRFEPEAGPGGAMTVVTPSGFGTVCASLIALPDPIAKRRKPIWLFAAGRPGEVPFKPVLPPPSGVIV
jgi:hypothetical protein